jgi:hypothetical protein
MGRPLRRNLGRPGVLLRRIRWPQEPLVTDAAVFMSDRQFGAFNAALRCARG